MNNKELPARIRFLLQDTVELRENNWVPRKAFIDNGPKTINQIRQDAVKVSRVKLVVSVVYIYSVRCSSPPYWGTRHRSCFLHLPWSLALRLETSLQQLD